MKKNIDTKKLLFENMEKLNPEFELPESVNLNMLFPMNEYKKKANEIKAVVDSLLRDEDDEALDTLYRLIVRRTKPVQTPEELKEIFNKFEKYGH